MSYVALAKTTIAKGGEGCIEITADTRAVAEQLPETVRRRRFGLSRRSCSYYSMSSSTAGIAGPAQTQTPRATQTFMVTGRGGRPCPARGQQEEVAVQEAE